MESLDNVIAQLQCIESINDIGAFKARVKDSYTWLEEHFSTIHVDELVTERARFTDALLRKAWDLQKLNNVKALSLCAVGGYGRSELCPHSDLDVVLLHRSLPDIADLAQRLWYPIWDEGVKLGHAVRTPDEALDLAGEDLDTATSLLSIRHLAGDRTLTDAVATDALG